MSFDKDMQAALQADGEKLRQMTGEDHGPIFDDPPAEPEADTDDPNKEDVLRIIAEALMTLRPMSTTSAVADARVVLAALAARGLDPVESMRALAPFHDALAQARDLLKSQTLGDRDALAKHHTPRLAYSRAYHIVARWRAKL